ncbi:hypothetical protein P1P75_08310 [Streptomyces sp. ID05-39B]|uniref:hypothetical protein n=1 Tax=Streptomyces sp. ID05-39B TaxID=3028664 RepID=UPI0029BAFD09|nr:hypothetical protein [Streptomyces sp. ID05-39B]MDX3526443.1 hypothetical protein [Streptomyces sp. ID05-39B]
MTDVRGRRRRGRRWAFALWALTAVVGGGLTLWLQDAAKPSQPPAWHRDENPAPLLEMDADDVRGCPTPTPAADDPGVTDVQCVYVEVVTP